MNEKIRQLLKLAIHAPSGENCQPWKFKIRGNQLEIWTIPERDNSLYNWGQRPSYVAHGALIENISIAASSFGLLPQIKLFPDPARQDCVVSITFYDSEQKTHPLFSFIPLRTTNRKPYVKTPLAKEQKEELFRVFEKGERDRIVFAEQEQKLKILGEAAAGNERILFENPRMHKFFYEHITWSEKEDRKKKIGFYIKTFELSPPAEKMFKLARKPGFVRVANKIGFSKMIVKQNAKVYSSASAMGAILIPNNSPEEFLMAGRMMQRVWLTAAKLDLSLQPLTGILFLMQGILAGRTEYFTSQQQTFIRDQYEQIKKTFGVETDTIAMMFRIGDGGKPTDHSLRLEPQIEALA